jgi:transposase
MKTQQRGVSGWGDMIAFFTIHRQEFDALYHRRVQVESVNSAIKRRFGESLRSRTPTSRRNELLCKLIAYNLVVLIQQIHLLHAEEEWLDRIL